jgi:hypothetical protein
LSAKRKGKRKRKAGALPKPVAKAAAPAKLAKRVSSPDAKPPAPWGSVPLAELVILAGIVSLAVGVLGGHPTAIGLGVALAGLGGMEVAIREHFAGYRSHTTLLAGTAFVLTVGLLFYVTREVLAVCLPIGAVVFVVVFFLARRAFQRASGGLSYRVGGMRG